ncbi:MAG: hypothetical protein KAR05_01230 [Candidatus Omnitrophica bacterium]|nr:hypothetical protein [Candidatus Omnitrophota bacterium]
MKSLKVYGIAVVISILFVAPLKAQELDVDSLTGAIRSQGYREWKQTVADVKGQTRTLLDENESLKTEHAYLKEKLSKLHESIDSLKEDTRKIEAENGRLRNFQLTQIESMESREDELHQLQLEVNAVEEKNQEKRTALRTMEEQNRVDQMEITSLQTKKRELALDLRLQEYDRMENDYMEEETTAVKNLKNKLRKLQQEEERKIAELQEAAQDSESLPLRVDRIKRESLQFEEDIAMLKEKSAKQKRVNRDFKRKNAQAVSAMDKVPAKLVKERDALQSHVDVLERRLEKIKSSVAKASAVIERKRALMDEIMSKDKKNQELRDTVSELLNEIQAVSGEHQ